MKAMLVFALVVGVGGCATGPGVPGGMAAGRFVALSCADNKSFQVRFAEDGRSARVRSHQGSAELEHRSDGVFAGEQFVLRTRGDGAISLDHAGKAQGRGCRATG